MSDDTSSVHRPQAVITAEVLSHLADSPNTYGYFMAVGDPNLDSERAYKSDKANIDALKRYGLLSETSGSDGHRLTELGKTVRDTCTELTDAAVMIDEWEDLFRLLPSWDETILSRSLLQTAECVSGSAFTGNQGADELLRRVHEEAVFLIAPRPAHREILAREGADADIVLMDVSISKDEPKEWTPPSSPPQWFRYVPSDRVSEEVQRTVTPEAKTSVAITDTALLMYVHDAADPHRSVLVEIPASSVPGLMEEFRSLRTAAARLN